MDKLDKQSKGLDRIPEIRLKLKDMELDFHWTVVGDGDYKEYLESKIQDYGLTNNFSFVGKTTKGLVDGLAKCTNEQEMYSEFKKSTLNYKYYQIQFIGNLSD